LILDKNANTNNWHPSDQGRHARTVASQVGGNSIASRGRVRLEGTKWSKFR
jgi:hypothetical protein